MAGSSDIESIMSLLKIAEELLFSFPLPQDLVSKYEFMRAKTLAKCHLANNNSHIKILQVEAHSKDSFDEQKVIHTSTISLKDADVQSRINSSSNFILKLFGFIERCIRLFDQVKANCQNIVYSEGTWESHSKNLIKLVDLPTRSLDLSESEYESLFESYKKSLSSNEHDIFFTLSKVEEKLKSNSVYIQKLELEQRENSSYLSKNNSELLEKNKALQEKFNKERLETEKKIKEMREEILMCKSNSLNDVRKAQNREIEKIIQERDMFQIESERLKDQLESVRSSLQQELRTLHEEYDRTTQEMGRNFSFKLKDSESGYIEKIEDLERKLHFQEKELKNEIEDLAFEKKEIVARLEKDLVFYKNGSETLQNTLEIVKGITDRIYKKFCDQPAEGKDLLQTLSKQVEYLDRVIEKLSSDNNWLVDRISELNKENENLRKALKESKIKETISELETSNSVLKNFEYSREKLKQKFSESSVAYPDTYSKLVHKYSNLS